MASRAWASLTTFARSQPEIWRPAVYLRRATAKEPPMRPVPRIVTRLMRCPADTLGHAAADGGRDDAKLGHELSEVGGIERLRSIGERVVRIVVHFDEQAVRAGGNGSAGHGGNFVAAASAVGGIRDHGQVRELLDDGYRGDVQGVAGIGLESADAALA